MSNQAMRNGQNKRMRGRNRKSQNPLTRVYESNGPDVKIRGTATHVADKYVQLARDAQANGDPVAAENYYQHAEHYYRLIALAQEQFRQANPYYRPEADARDDMDEGDDEGVDQPMGAGGADQPYGTGEQPFIPREAQPFPPREPQHYAPREPRPYGGRPQQPGHQPSHGGPDPSVAPDQLPSFITGGGQPQAQPPQNYGQQNGYDNQSGDRFPLHRRRRRHRGPRDQAGGPQGAGEGSDAPPPRPNSDG
jgi:hypothetical protein